MVNHRYGNRLRGPEVQIAFNPVFLQEPLHALSHDEIFFEFKDELSPGIVKTLNQFLCVIMPLRLGNPLSDLNVRIHYTMNLSSRIQY